MSDVIRGAALALFIVSVAASQAPITDLTVAFLFLAGVMLIGFGLRALTDLIKEHTHD